MIQSQPAGEQAKSRLKKLLKASFASRQSFSEIKVNLAKEGVEITPSDILSLDHVARLEFHLDGFTFEASRKESATGVSRFSISAPIVSLSSPKEAEQQHPVLPVADVQPPISTPIPHPPATPKKLLLKAVYDGFTFALLFAYFPNINLICKDKEYGGFFEHEKGQFHKFWRFDKSVIDGKGEELYRALTLAAPPEIAETQEDFFSKIEAARVQPDPAAFTDKLQFRVHILEQGETLLGGSFHRGAVALVKSMTAEARFVGPMKAWRLPGVAPAVLRNNLITELCLREDQVVIEDGVYVLAAGALLKVKDKKHLKVVGAEPPEGAPDNLDDDSESALYLSVVSPLEPSAYSEADIREKLTGYDVYDYQIPGVIHLVGKTSALLADDMGLGKTRQAVVSADILVNWSSGKVLVVCPASLLINWHREIAAVDSAAKVALQCWDQNAKWIVTNYERLEAILPYADQFKVMIVDEAHYLKEPSNMRTRLAFDVAAKIPHRYLLTGTPVLNRESEIHTLLRLSGHPLGSFPLPRFVKEFAGDSEFRVNLNKRIGEWMLRRRKDVVLTTLKGKQHQVQYVTVTPEQRARYDQVVRDPNLLVLQKITKLRQILESIKLDSVIEMITELQGDDKVLVFCEFKETISELTSRLEGLGIRSVRVTGSDSTKRRQAAVDAFQDDTQDVRVFLGITRAAGIGWNLTAANYVLFPSQPWNPALKDQAEDRAYRNGQMRLVIVKDLLLEDSIDIGLRDMLKHKKGIATDIIDPEATDAADDVIMAEFAKHFQHQALAAQVPAIAI